MTAHRKLIRPSIKKVKESQGQPSEMPMQPITPSAATSPMLASRRKQVPAEQTNAESFYYLKQMQTKTNMVFILQDGEQIRGYIEWYDRHCLKVNRHKEPNLMIMKHCIKYMYKQEEEVKSHRRRKRTTETETPAPKKPKAP
ncbi:MAG: RNA chaperone Hfq [Acidobacteriota bacterium]|nr:RNA chaperone Hfq [Acidobacteriota bacterium]